MKKRQLVAFATVEHGLSERRSCRLLGTGRSGLRYNPKGRDDSPIIEVLQRLADSKPRWGFQKMFDWLRNQGYRWNHERVRRVYRQLTTQLAHRAKETAAQTSARTAGGTGETESLSFHRFHERCAG